MTPRVIIAPTLGDRSFAAIENLAVDGSGNIYASGFYTGEIDFDPGEGTHLLSTPFDGDGYPAYSSAFVARYDAQGALGWVWSTADSAQDNIATGLAVGADGHAAAAGLVGEGADRSLLLTELDGGGDVVWQHTVTTSNYSSNRHAVAIDAAGAVHVAGSFAGTADFDGGSGTLPPLIANPGYVNHYVAEYDTDGTLAWVTTATQSSYNEVAAGIALDGSGGSYVVGWLNGQADFGGTVSLDAGSGGGHVFLAKYDAQGAVLWARQPESWTGQQFGQDVAVSADGNVHISGVFVGTVDFDGAGGAAPLIDSTPEFYDTSFFVATYDADGNFLWARSPDGAPQHNTVEAIAADAAGNVYVAGNFGGVMDLDGAGPVPALDQMESDQARTSFFVAKYDPQGTLLWATTTEASLHGPTAYALAVDDAGHIFVGGALNGIADFDPGPGELLASSEDGVFIIEYSADGVLGTTLAPPDLDAASDTGISDSDDLTRDATPNFSGTGSDGDVYALMEDDSVLGTATVAGGAWSVTASTLADGVHHLHLRATDGDGFASSSDALAVTIDTQGPDTSITAAPATLTSHDHAVFDFGSDDSAGTYEASLDGASYAAVTGPTTYLGLDDGTHTLLVRAVDAAGNPDATPARFAWTVDTEGAAAPGITGYSSDTGEPGDRLTTDTTPTLEGTAEPDATVHVLRDGRDLGTARADADGAWHWTDAAGTGFGARSYSAYAEDAVGNAGSPSQPFLVFVADPRASAGNGDDLIAAGAGSGGVDGRNGDDTIFGEAGNDTLKGGNGDDWLAGGGENDAIWGGNGNDAGWGGKGNDTLYGEAGADTLSGDDGGDRIEGGSGGDRIDGGAGADTLYGGDGADTLVGGPGADRIFSDAASDWVLLDADGSPDTVCGSLANLSGDTIFGFEVGRAGDAIAVTGLASSYGRYLDDLTVVDGTLSLARVGGGTIELDGLVGTLHTDTMLGSDGSLHMYLV